MQPAFARIHRCPTRGTRVRDAHSQAPRFGIVDDAAPQVGVIWVIWDDGRAESLKPSAVIPC